MKFVSFGASSTDSSSFTTRLSICWLIMCLPSSRKAADSLVSIKRPVSAKLKAISLTALASASFFQIFQLYSAAEKRAILDGSDCCIGLRMTPPIRLGSTPGCRNFSPPPKMRCCLELSVHGQLIQS